MAVSRRKLADALVNDLARATVVADNRKPRG